MKKLLLIALLIVGCGNSTEPEPEDCAGVSGGDAVEDCSGECDGSAVIDDCNICGGDGSTCCEDGETNNDNPCNPWECSNGQWIEMIIDCAEPMGVLCEGGAYIPPEEGECCSECVLFGESEDCNPELICGQALTCCDGLLYPTTCCDSNCDEPIEGQNCP